MSVLILSHKQIALVAAYVVEQRQDSYQLWAGIVAEKMQEGTVSSNEMDLAKKVIESASIKDTFAQKMFVVRAIVRTNLESYIARYNHLGALEESCINRPDLVELAQKLDRNQGSALDQCTLIDAICQHYVYFVQGYLMGQSIKKEMESVEADQYKVWLKSTHHQLCDSPLWDFSIAKSLTDLETMNFDSALYQSNKWMIS